MKIRFLDKLGTIGALLAASSCPVCFPLLAIVGSALGLGFLRPYEGIMMSVFQFLVFLAFIGNIVSFLNHRKLILLYVGIISPIIIFFTFYIKFISILFYMGLFGLLASAILNYFQERKCDKCKITFPHTEVILKSKIKCPFCRYVKEETMSVDSCQFYYNCTNCKRILRPKEGDCCVFCSYGSIKCPPKQRY